MVEDEVELTDEEVAALELPVPTDLPNDPVIVTYDYDGHQRRWTQVCARDQAEDVLKHLVETYYPEGRVRGIDYVRKANRNTWFAVAGTYDHGPGTRMRTFHQYLTVQDYDPHRCY